MTKKFNIGDRVVITNLGDYAENAAEQPDLAASLGLVVGNGGKDSDTALNQLMGVPAGWAFEAQELEAEVQA